VANSSSACSSPTASKHVEDEDQMKRRVSARKVTIRRTSSAKSNLNLAGELEEFFSKAAKK
jgi:hypothetical protein